MIKYICLFLALLQAGCCFAVYPMPLSRTDNELKDIVISPSTAEAVLSRYKKCDFANGTLEGIITDIKTEFVTPFQSIFPRMIPSTGYSGLLYYVMDNQLIAERFNSGEKQWSVPVEGFLAQVLEENGITAVYIAKENRVFLRAYDASNGALLWQRQDAPGRAFLKYANGRLYAYNHCVIKSYDLTNGELMLEKALPEYVVIIRDIYVKDYTLIVNVFDTRNNSEDAMCIDFFTGSVKWLQMGEGIYSEEDKANILRRSAKLVNVRKTDTGALDSYYFLPNYDERFVAVSEGIIFYSAKSTEFASVPPVVNEKGIVQAKNE
ncbi:MAG: PQQ-binding-like beta-propeller repeat protein, partial [Planctomycetes bacterium]|nr:PQQ-binding-like beta-propeller repeat protein [Planctomycetota bacterium]